MSLISSNLIVSPTLNALYNQLNGNCYFGLFQNNIVLTPSTTLVQLSPATFPGYASFSTQGKWTVPIKQQDGIYETTLTAGPFLCTGGNQVIYGGYLTDGTNLLYSQTFGTPLTVQTGTYFNVPITLQVVSSGL